MGRYQEPTVITFQLSPAERRVYDAMKTGASNAGIAIILGLSIKGVKFQITSIYSKMRVKSRGEFLVKAAKYD